MSQHQSSLNNSFISSPDATFSSMASLNGLDIQTLAVTGQLPAQSLATLQAAGLGRSSAKPGLPLPLVDQRNLFSFDSPKMRYGEGQQQHMSSSKPMNLLHGIPTTMEPKQLANLHQSAQSLGGVNLQVNAHGAQNSSLLMQMAQTQSRGQILNETTGGHVPRLPSSMGQPIVSNGIASGVLGRNGIADNGRGAGYNPVLQNSSLLNFPLNQTSELQGTNSFPIGSTSGLPSLTSKGGFPDEVNSEIKVSAGFVPSYDIFNDLNQHKSSEWDIQNVGMTFDASQHSNSMQGNLDVPSAVLVHQGFSSSQRNLQNRNESHLSKAMFSAGDDTDHGNVQNINQHINAFLGENSVRVKTERIPDAGSHTPFFPEQFGQEDLMSALLKQVSFSLFISMFQLNCMQFIKKLNCMHGLGHV